MNVKSMHLKTSLFSIFPGEILLEILLAEGAWRVPALLLAEEALGLARSYKTPFLLLTGAVSSDENLDAGDLIQACLNQGLVPLVELSGQEKPLWLSLVPTRLVHIRSKDWLLYPASEIVYRPKTLEDPAFDPVLHAKSAFVLDLNPAQFSPEDVLRFLSSSQLHWRLKQGGVSIKKDFSAVLPILEREKGGL